MRMRAHCLAGANAAYVFRSGWQAHCAMPRRESSTTAREPSLQAETGGPTSRRPSVPWTVRVLGSLKSYGRAPADACSERRCLVSAPPHGPQRRGNLS